MSEWRAFPQSKPRSKDYRLYLVTIRRPGGRLSLELRTWADDHFVGVGQVVAFMPIPEPYRSPEVFKADCSRKF